MFQSTNQTILSPPGLQEMLKANKLAFDTTYQLMCQFQDNIQRLAGEWIEQSMSTPEKMGKQQFDWFDALKQERARFKETIDLGFDALEGFLEPTQTEKSSQRASAKVEAATGKKASNEKSAPRRAAPRRKRTGSAKSAG
jgi:hypothetical protein